MAEKSVKPRVGCLIYGAIIAMVLLVAILGAVWLGMRTLNQFTDTAPVPVPVSQMPTAQVQLLKDRVSDFERAVSQERETPPLELSADDVNALIATEREPWVQALRGKLFVTAIKGNRVQTQVCLPLGQLGVSALKGRYLNGIATLRVSLQNGVLELRPDSVEVRGKPFPGIFMNRLRGRNLAAEINDNSRASTAMETIDAQLKDDKLVITPKPPQP